MDKPKVDRRTAQWYVCETDTNGKMKCGGTRRNPLYKLEWFDNVEEQDPEGLGIRRWWATNKFGSLTIQIFQRY